MPEIVVPAESRTETGKNANRRLRSRGLIPGVLYGRARRPVAVPVSPRRDRHDPEERRGREHAVRPRDRRQAPQGDPQGVPARAAASGKLLHADFYEVALDKKLEVKVHVELEGTPVGVKLQGGILDFVTRELEIECLPADIPEKIVVDISRPRARASTCASRTSRSPTR